MTCKDSLPTVSENEGKFSNNASLTETMAKFNSRLATNEDILSEREKHVAELNIELAKSQSLSSSNRL